MELLSELKDLSCDQMILETLRSVTTVQWLRLFASVGDWTEYGSARREVRLLFTLRFLYYGREIPGKKCYLKKLEMQ